MALSKIFPPKNMPSSGTHLHCRKCGEFSVKWSPGMTVTKKHRSRNKMQDHENKCTKLASSSVTERFREQEIKEVPEWMNKWDKFGTFADFN